MAAERERQVKVLARARRKVAPERQTESGERVGFDGDFRRYRETDIGARESEGVSGRERNG